MKRARVDEVDRAIVALLQEDGRMPCTQIGRRLGYLSARTVGNRIRRLTKRGVIRVTAVVNPRELGYAIAADVAIEVTPGKVMQVAEAVAALDRVSYVATVAGDRDVSIQVNAVELEDLQGFITRELHGVEGVQRTTVILLTQVMQDIYEWEIPSETLSE